MKMEKDEISVINFSGLPVLIKKNAHNFSEKEFNYIKKLNYHNSSHTNTTLKISEEKYILKNQELKNIKNIFDKYIEIYKKNILQINNNTCLLNSWVTWHSTDSIHPSHTHPNTLISLVYYVKCDEGSISFVRDKSMLCNGYYFEYDIINYNEYNSAVWNVPVKTGDLIIFPGWIRHAGNNFLKNSDRYLIAANYFLKGKTGNNLKATYLEI